MQKAGTHVAAAALLLFASSGWAFIHVRGSASAAAKDDAFTFLPLVLSGGSSNGAPTATQVPNVSLTPTPTAQPTATPTVVPSATTTPEPTQTPTATSTPTPSPAFTATPTATSTPVQVASASSTQTATASPIATNTATPIAIATATSSATSTHTPPPSPTSTPVAISTPTPSGPNCGNSVIESGEMCDDGNAEDRDGCTTQCVIGVPCDTNEFQGGAAYVTDPATGVCYVRYQDETNYGNAQSLCASIGGDLATITSANEQALVHSIQSGIPWIGGDDMAVEGNFAWLSGEPFSYANFSAGEPDDDISLGGNGDCLVLMNSAGEWGDTNCDFVGLATGRICEIPVALIQR